MKNELKLKARRIAHHLEAMASSHKAVTQAVVNAPVPQTFPAVVTVRGAGEVEFDSFELFWETRWQLVDMALRDPKRNKPRTAGQRTFARNLAKAGFA